MFSYRFPITRIHSTNLQPPRNAKFPRPRRRKHQHTTYERKSFHTSSAAIALQPTYPLLWSLRYPANLHTHIGRKKRGPAVGPRSASKGAVSDYRMFLRQCCCCWVSRERLAFAEDRLCATADVDDDVHPVVLGQCRAALGGTRRSRCCARVYVVCGPARSWFLFIVMCERMAEVLGMGPPS